jgi:predicted transcriptional regulator
MPIKVASEVRKLIFLAEVKYKFSIYDGDIRNLKLYLESREFADLVDFLRSTNCIDVLVEVLERAKKAYSDIEYLRSTIERALYQVKESLTKGSNKEDELLRSIDELAERLKKKINTKQVKMLKRTIRLVIDENTELKIKVFRGRVIVEVLVRRVIEKPAWKDLLEVIERFVEKTRYI